MNGIVQAYLARRLELYGEKFEIQRGDSQTPFERHGRHAAGIPCSHAP
jgi:hypothetical protein